MNISKLNFNTGIIYDKRTIAPNYSFRGDKEFRPENGPENSLYGYSLSACTMPQEVLAAHLKRQEALGGRKAGVDPIYDSFHDSMSGLRNKEYLMCRLPILCQNAINNDDGICVAMFDMDNFKSINQFLGYSTGDEFIKEISSQIKKIANKNDLGAYRYGGEEFVIIFKSSDTRKAKLIADEVLKNIEQGKLRAYLDEYKSTGLSQLVKAEAENTLISNLTSCHHKSLYTKELLEKYITQTGDTDSTFANFLKNERVQSDIALINAYEKIIRKACSKEKDKKIAQKLSDAIQQIKDINETINMYNEINSSIASHEDQSTLVNKTLLKMRNNIANFISDKAEILASHKQLFDYLCGKFSRKAEVVQYKNWLNSIENMGNFTITCGIKQFYADDLEQFRNKDGCLMPEKIVDKAGDVLKRGKAEHKGQVYVEHSF